MNHAVVSDVFSISSGQTATFNINLDYDENSTNYRAFSVSQALIFGQEFAEEILDINFSDSCINIAYPTNGVSFSFHIVSSLEATAWKDWQTVLHEFGHYVQSVSGLYDNNLMEIIRYKPNHSYDDDALEAHGDSLYSLKLAWMESWATIFSFVCYDYYAQYYPIPDFAIECFDIINEFEDLYFGNRKRDKYSCEAQETSIIGYLWDLYDSDNEAEENDYISLGVEGLMNATMQEGISTLNEFVQRFNNDYHNLVNDNSLRLEFGQLAPDITDIIYNDNGSVSLKWKVNGSENNPFDKFTLKFYIPNMVLQTESIENITSNSKYNEKHTFTLSREFIDNLFFKYPTYYRACVVVEGYNEITENIINGSYPSAKEELILLNRYAELSIKDFMFKTGYSNEEQIDNLKVDGKGIQTQRLRCFSYNDEGVVLLMQSEKSYFILNFSYPIKAMVATLTYYGMPRVSDTFINTAMIKCLDYRHLLVNKLNLYDDTSLIKNAPFGNTETIYVEFEYGSRQIIFETTCLDTKSTGGGTICISNVILLCT